MARTGLPIGRPKKDPSLAVEPPSNTDLQPSSNYVWVEGRVLVEGYLDEKRIWTDKLHEAAAKIGLVVHEQDITTVEEGKSYRRWSSKRVSMDEAAAALQDFPKGVTIQDFAKYLYEEKPWTELHQIAAVKKTYVVVQKLFRAGLLTKDRMGRLFTTRKAPKETVPPILIGAVKNTIDELGGEQWPDYAVSKLIRAVANRLNEIDAVPKKIGKKLGKET